MIAIVTDSNAQLPEPLRDRYRIRVVPMTVVIDGVEYQEGVDLRADNFFSVSRGRAVSTSAPSPGDILARYAAAAAAGANEILSVHVGSNVSATVSAAGVAAGFSRVPVEIVDTGTASFAVGCCVWEAAEALCRGARLVEAAQAARSVADRVDNVFATGALDAARRGGRLAADVREEGVPVLALRDGLMRSVAAAGGVADAIDAMSAYVEERSRDLRIRAGVGDAAAPEAADQLAARLTQLAAVVEVVRYRVGPSVAAHTGAGTFGAVFYSLDR